MSPNIMNMEKEPQERDMLQEDGERDGPKPKVRPVETVLERLYRMGYTRRAILIIAVLAVLTLILLVTVIALAARPCCATPPSDRPLCVEPDCYRTTARILQYVNNSVQPCEDFYEFACGGWVRDHQPIPAGFGDVGVTVNALRDFQVKTRAIIETLHYPDNFRLLQWKVKAFYHSCMDLDSVDSAGDAFLNRQIDLLKGWKPKKNWVMASWDSAKVMRDLHVDYGVSPFFAVSVRMDDINPHQNVIQISPSGLGLPHFSLYFRSEDDKIIKAYQRLMRDLAVTLGVTFTESSEFAKEVFQFEKRVAEYLQSEAHNEEGKEKAKDKKKITLAELRQESQMVNWVDFLKAYFPKTYISESTPIYVESLSYIRALSTILSTTNRAALNSYLIWTLIFKYAPYLSKNYRDNVEAYRLVFSGATESRARWEFCIEATNRIFSVALTSYYVKKHVPKSAFEEAEDIFKHVKNTFADTLKSMSWTNDTTSKVSHKVRGINSQLQYDKYVLSDAGTVLDLYYEILEISRTDFVQNIQNGAIFHRFQYENALANTSISYMVLNTKSESNPYYSEFNRYVAKPIFLQEPYIHSSYPKYMTFASLGSRLGRHLIREIEETAINITHPGHLTTILWSNVTLPLSYQECLASNYSHYEINDHKINGNKSLGSNLADIGGLDQAYKAMIDWEKNYGLEPTLPALTYTPEQLFFISYAQTMCSSMRPDYLNNYLELSQSPPDKIRVLAAMAQLPQFSSAFGCKPEPHHCTLW